MAFIHISIPCIVLAYHRVMRGWSVDQSLFFQAGSTGKLVLLYGAVSVLVDLRFDQGYTAMHTVL